MNRYAHWLLRHRIAVIVATLVVTAVLGAFGAGLKVVIDPARLAPQGHPYIEATNRVDSIFGSKYLMLIGVTPKQGDIFQPAVLERVQRLTDKLGATPGVVKSTLISLAAPQAKAIKGTADGFEARPLLPGTTLTAEQQQALRAALESNPIYKDTVVSSDYRTAAIMVELKERSDGFQKMVQPVKDLVAAEAGPEVELTLGGNPAYLDKTELFAQRINILFPIAILVIGLLHFEAFRTKQGLILPLVTALMAVIWGTGFMGALGQQLDIFNSPTPILILAIAAGHAVQLLKRYYEDYETLRKQPDMDAKTANREAVIRSLVGVGPVMLIAGGVAALGFLSLLVFNIATIRAFGIFTAVGIASAVVLEMTFIPAVRSLLRPPAVAAARKERVWDRIPRWVGDQIVPAQRRRWMMVGLAAFVALCVVSMHAIVIDNSSKNFFAKSLDVQLQDQFLNEQLGGTNSLYIMVEGKNADAIKDPAVLRAIESTQQLAATQPHVGKTVSIVDYLKRMNQAMNGDAPAANRLPETRELVSQYLLLYSLSGAPEDFSAYVDYKYQAAKITILLKTGSNAYIKELVAKLEAHTAQVFGPEVRVSFGGDTAQTIALTDTMVQGKIMNILQISAAVLLISALAFRAITAGFIVLAPLAIAVLAVFGTMGLCNIPLNIPNSLIAAMAVGIGADYAIYLLYRMRERVRQGASAEDAVRETLATAGKATLFVGTAVAGGFGVLALSIGYNVHLWLALFIVLAMVASALASLTLVPSLVLYLRPAFIFDSEKRAPVWHLVVLLAAASALLVFAARTTRADDLTPLAIMQKNLASTKVADSLYQATLTLTNSKGDSRIRKINGTTRLQANGNDNMRLVRFNSPADIQGTATLLIERSDADDDLWIYLPALGKVRRLSASNKKDSFVGTDFSYGDVVGLKPEQWRHELLREEAVRGAASYVIQSTPLDPQVQRDTGYSKRVTWVDKQSFVALKGEFWDTAGQPLKRFEAKEVRSVGSNNRFQPMLSEVENLQTGHRTTIKFDDFKADQKVDAGLFRPQQLDRP